jgi:hypothetical protein
VRALTSLHSYFGTESPNPQVTSRGKIAVMTQTNNKKEAAKKIKGATSTNPITGQEPKEAQCHQVAGKKVEGRRSKVLLPTGHRSKVQLPTPRSRRTRRAACITSARCASPTGRPIIAGHLSSKMSRTGTSAASLHESPIHRSCNAHVARGGEKQRGREAEGERSSGERRRAGRGEWAGGIEGRHRRMAGGEGERPEAGAGTGGGRGRETGAFNFESMDRCVPIRVGLRFSCDLPRSVMNM